MKKFLSLMIVAVLLVSSLSVSAFAATITPEGDGSRDVYAKYAEGSKTHAYKVEIKWGDMKFTYSATNESWNVDTHKWDTTSVAGWSVDTKGGDEITITNHSSQSVKATLNFAPTSGLGVTGGTFSGNGVSNNEVTIGVGNSTTGAVVQTIKFVPTGELNSSNTTETNIGKITITLN